LLVLLGAAAGCATAPTHQALQPLTPCNCAQAVVFCADGAGNSAGLTEALRQGAAEAGLPLDVEMVDWSYGHWRFLADQMDYGHAQAAGVALAARVAAYRQTCPTSRLYLIGHSAGSAVVLTAAEQLPPNSVDRIVLLAPAVSSRYDLRPALRCAHEGIDVFSSERDLAILGLGVAIVGTTDRRWTAAAGRVGFRPVVETPEDACLYGKLRQHPWNLCVAWTGNEGGHFGTYLEPLYLSSYVLPLFAAARPGGTSGHPGCRIGAEAVSVR
jgi:pimeloyl-ACP methyl ester carboxylesterase